MMTIECPKCQHKNPEDTAFCGKCGTPLSSQESPPTKTLKTHKEELTRGTVFAHRYEIIEELGKGGMGKVYRVEDKRLNQEIALKLIKPEVAKNKKTIQRFRNELTTARMITHKNVCRMFDLGEAEGAHFITMEYIRGEDLKSFIRRAAPLSTARTLSIAKQVCEGLAEAHKLGVIHRDLKPQNIMIDKQGNTRIMDFGIARSLKGKGITGAGVMIGTPEYMSPEQVEGKDVDQRSDIYSLGVILYEMATGQVPFEGDTPFTIGVKHKSEMPENPKELNTQMPDGLSRVILRCLEKDKGERFQNAAKVRSELEKIEQGIPTTERKIPKKKPLTSREITVTFGLKKILIPAAVVAVLIIGAVILWRFALQKESLPPVQTEKPSIAVLYFENNSGKETLDHWRSGLSEMLITDLSQSKFLHILSSDRIYSLMERFNLTEKDKYSTEDLKKVARQGGASHVLRGSFITAGEKFIINVSLMNPQTTGIISSLREEGMGEVSITDSLDQITQHIKKDLDLSEEQISSDLDKELSQITTQSPEALKYYVQGVKLHDQGRYRAAIPLYERAVQIDPEFALAYRRLGTAYGNLGLAPQKREYMEKAMKLKDRLSDKERLLIEGSYYDDFENTYEKAIASYKNLLKTYPKNPPANHNLALIFSNLDQRETAVLYYERARDAGAEFVGTYTSLAYCYRVLGEYDKSKQVLEDYIENKGAASGIHRELANHYRHFEKYDPALSEVEKALSLEPANFWNLNLQANIYRCKKDLKKAENIYWKLYGLTEPGAGYCAVSGLFSLNLVWGKYNEAQSWLKQGITGTRELNVKWPESEWRSELAYLHGKTGRYEEALKECDLSLEDAAQAYRSRFYYQRSALHRKGLVQLAHHSIYEAQNTAQKLKEFIEAGINEKSIRLYYHLMGRIEIEKGNYAEAEDLIQKALSLTPFQRDDEFMESLAWAHYRAGDLDNAIKQYEKIISLTPGNIYFGDIYSRSFYMLGKIHQKKGHTSEALTYYEKFLDLWKDADPGLPEVKDARKRMAEL